MIFEHHGVPISHVGVLFPDNPRLLPHQIHRFPAEYGPRVTPSFNCSVSWGFNPTETSRIIAWVSGCMRPVSALNAASENETDQMVTYGRWLQSLEQAELWERQIPAYSLQGMKCIGVRFAQTTSLGRQQNHPIVFRCLAVVVVRLLARVLKSNSVNDPMPADRTFRRIKRHRRVVQCYDITAYCM